MKGYSIAVRQALASEWFPVGIAFLIVVCAYLLTLCPTIYPGDGPALTTAAYCLGSGHPPGYPLFYLLGRLFCFLPLGSVAWRVNLVVAFAGALCSGLVALFVIRLLGWICPGASYPERSFAGLIAGTSLGLSQSFWSYAVVAEVYTLSCLFIALLLLFLISWAQHPQPKTLYAFAFCYGVGITCHQLLLLLAPAFALFFLIYKPRLLGEARVMLKAFGCLFLGLSLYLYLPLSSMVHPPLDWAKIRSLPDFWDYLMRRQYGSTQQNYNPAYFTSFSLEGAERWKEFVKLLTSEFSSLWLLSLPGFIWLFFRAKRVVIVASLILYLTTIRLWSIVPLDLRHIEIAKAFLIHGYLLISIFVGLGTFWLISNFREFEGMGSRIPFYLLGTIPFFLLISRLPERSLKGNYIAYDYGVNILNSLEKNALLFARGDNELFSLVYLKVVEGYRPDVTIFDDLGGDVFKNTPYRWMSIEPRDYGPLIGRIVARSGRPIYSTYGYFITAPAGYSWKRLGIVNKLIPSRDLALPQDEGSLWRHYRLRFAGEITSQNYLARILMANYFLAFSEYALERRMFSLGLFTLAETEEMGEGVGFVHLMLAKAYADHGLMNEALRQCKKAQAYYPDDVDALFNLGVTYARMRNYAEAIQAWKRVLELDPENKMAQEYIKKATAKLRPLEKQGLNSKSEILNSKQ